MISGFSKKVISFYILFIHFIQPGDTVEFYKINKTLNRTNNLNWSRSSNKIQSTNSLKLLSSDFQAFSNNKELLNKNKDEQLANVGLNQDELIIESNKQSEIGNVIYAEGNVSVSYKGKNFKADNLTYDRLEKKISANGNIALIFGNQTFRVSRLEYNFISKKGYLLDVKGSINTDTFFDDLSSNFNLSDADKLKGLLEFKKKEVLNTPGKVENWTFFTDKMTIDGNIWKSNKVILSNDLLELKQVKLAINSLEVISNADELRFKSSLNNLIFEEKVSIPFWYGERT